MAATSLTPTHKWLYEESKGSWKEYGPLLQQELENSKQAGRQKLKITINGEIYDIDFEKMKQTKRSDQTKVRKIKREIVQPAPQPNFPASFPNIMVSPFAPTAAQLAPSMLGQALGPPAMQAAFQPSAVAATPAVATAPTVSSVLKNVISPPGNKLYLSQMLSWNITLSVRSLTYSGMALILACVINGNW